MNNQITVASLPLPPDIHIDIDIDPLDGTTHCLLAVTGPGGEVVRVRLWVAGEGTERQDWAKAVGMMSGDAACQVASSHSVCGNKAKDEPAKEAVPDLQQPEG